MSANTPDQPRQPKGVPAGGQWRATPRPEGNVRLVGSPADPWGAAREGALPPDFDGWDLADKDGWTVAHKAAIFGHLPPGFDGWDLADKNGWTVAHAAAGSGHLPPGFDRWDLVPERYRPRA